MSSWRRKALELFPEFRREIECSDYPSDVWYEIRSGLLPAFDREDEKYFNNVKSYLSWCLNTPINSSPHQSALCGFIEDVGGKKIYWGCLDKIFTPQDFEANKSVLSYQLSIEQTKQLEIVFYKR